MFDAKLVCVASKKLLYRILQKKSQCITKLNIHQRILIPFDEAFPHDVSAKILELLGIYGLICNDDLDTFIIANCIYDTEILVEILINKTIK